jgi:collagenase-like PrtC family protease/putative sterol carrier protein
MRISLACNWKESLLNVLEQDSDLLDTVFDLYGTFDVSFTGSGRPFFLMSKRDKSEIETFINKVHELGLSFTWLWNGMCVGYKMFDSEEQTKALKELDWLDDMNVEYLTVADPYLAKFAKTYYPDLKLKVSVISEINSLSRALKWQEIIGKDGVLTLSVMLNRNFPLLKEITDSVDCDIEILTNDCCLNECPFRFFHYTECSHASQDHDILEGYYNDWAGMACQNQKAFHPEQLIMCKWIAPSDLHKYMEIGIDYFKISGRRYATEWLERVLRAYQQESYDKNMGEILNGYSFVADPLELAGGQFSEYASKQEKVGGYPDDAGIQLSIPDFNAKLDASKLTSFLDNMPFEGAKCAENCGVSCTYCYNFVDKAYKIPSEENANLYKDYMAYLFDYLNHGEMFVPIEERKLEPPIDLEDSDSYFGISWTPAAKSFLEKTMELIPEGMKDAANKAIKHTAERTAEKKEKDEINKELLISIIIRLIPKTFKHDLIDFLISEDIDPLKFLKDKGELEKIKSMPYGTPQEDDAADQPIPDSKSEESKVRISSREEWEQYLERYMKAYNELPELSELLEPVAPIVFQFEITDKPEMDYWQFFTSEGVKWGMEGFSDGDVPKIIHKTDFETIKKVNSGEIDAIQVSMTDKYEISGDMGKLMKCAPLLPLNEKVHSKITEKKQ